MPEAQLTATKPMPAPKTAQPKSSLNAQGYGILCKIPMLDPELTIEAKGIYCYLCAHAGADATAFPSREKMMAELKMCKDAYYKHYQLLLEQDYLRVEQKNIGGSGHGFLKNIYEIVDSPRKFRARSNNPRYADVLARIKSGSMQKAGYGTIPRSVMVDRTLSVKAKALYGYYRCFAGVGSMARPEKKDLLYHLGISAKLFAKLTDELQSHGLIALTQRHVNGRLSVNDVLILEEPKAGKTTRSKKLTVLSTGERTVSVSQKQDTQIKDAHYQETQKQDTQNHDVIKSKTNNTSVSQNQSDHQQCAAAQDRREDVQQNTLFALTALWETGTIPESWLGSRALIDSALSVLLSLSEAPEETEQKKLLFSRALTDMLCADRPMTLTGQCVTAHEVYDKLQQFISCGDGAQPVLFDLDELSLDAYESACRERAIKNPFAYLKSCIWTVLKTGDAALQARLAYDLG